MSREIIILTGKVQSGKTTALFKFINSRVTDGILAPVVNDMRRFYHISSKTVRDFESESGSENTVAIGKYYFLKKSFSWANKKLIESFHSNPDWLIVDEIGKLELTGEGLHDAAEYILSRLEDTDAKLILVIRDYLVKDALKKYNLEDRNYRIIHSIDEIS